MNSLQTAQELPPKQKRSGKSKAADRRALIREVATEEFASVGFYGARTASIAEKAGVSEALIFSHFPTKEALYKDVLTQAAQHTKTSLDQVFEKVEKVKPSTASLVHLTYYLLKNLSLFQPKSDSVDGHITRLFLSSLMNGGAFAEDFMKRRFKTLPSLLEDCLTAASASGDLTSPPPANLSFWFIHHLSLGFFLMRLPGNPIIEYKLSREEILNQSVKFSLRGLGLSESAIEKYYDPNMIALLEH